MVAGARRINPRARPNLRPISWLPEAKRAFATLDRANRYAFVYRVNDAKRPETRNKRIREFVEMLARGETIHPTKSKRAPRA